MKPSGEARPRCPWASADPLLRDYHDREWGVPVHDDRRLFEMLVLEGAQAGLSWLTVLRRRDAYRRAFRDFDPATVARFGPRHVERFLADPDLIRNRSKLEAAISNARAVRAVQREMGSLDAYLWSFVENRVVRSGARSAADVPATSDLSRCMSGELRRRGFRFVGPTILYAFQQAVGMVNDHLVGCFRYREV